jgi:hypothetical protein
MCFKNVLYLDKLGGRFMMDTERNYGAWRGLSIWIHMRIRPRTIGIFYTEKEGLESAKE